MAAEYRRQIADLSAVVGIGEEIFRPIRTYSGGMSRKLEIVRSLIHRPKVLFLDEPTSGLDSPSRRGLWSYLERVRTESNTTILLTTHYLEEAEQADRICIIDRGRVVSYGTPADIKADLVEEYVLVDAADRPALRAELAARGLPHSGGGPFRVELDGRATHAVLKAIETPLNVVQTHTPTLEDAYLEIVGRTDA
jgi:ABC-2 type transport system ATP-binding protein